MSERSNQSLAVRLRESDAEELLQLLRKHVQELNVPEVRQALRNPFLTQEAIELVLDERRLLAFSEIKRSLVCHPRTPEVRARRLVPTLFWRDLLQISGDGRVPPKVRRSADLQLRDRLAGLAVGERMSIARRASPALIQQLRMDHDPRVIEALLENPRLTEGSLMPLLGSGRAKPESLILIARHRRWGIRYGVRAALCRNSRTPQEIVLGLLSLLKKSDLRAVFQDRRQSVAVRRRAGTLLGHEPS
jgi:hypothetical protein